MNFRYILEQMNKEFPRLTFQLNSEKIHFFHGTPVHRNYVETYAPNWREEYLGRKRIYKKLSTNRIIYDRLQIGQHLRVVLSLDDNTFLLWYGAPIFFPRMFLPSLPLFFKNYNSIDVEPSFAITANSTKIHSRFDHFCSENIRPKDYRQFEDIESACRFAGITFQYQHAYRSLFKILRYKSFNIFWLIQTGYNIENCLSLSSYTTKYNYRLSVLTVEITLGNKKYIVFMPDRSHQEQFQGSENIPQDSEIITMRFIDEEVDSLWAVCGNEIKNYG